MAGLKEIRRRLRSVRNTSKITYAMKLVAGAKLKRVQEAVTGFRVYRDELDRVLKPLQIEQQGRESKHPLMLAHEGVKKVAVLVVGGQRGLCGGYNTNVNRKIETAVYELREKHPEAAIEFFIIGKKVADYFKRVKRDAVKVYDSLPENVSVWPISELSRELQRGFISEQYDEAYLIYTQFKTVISQKAVFEPLLPLSMEKEGSAGTQGITLPGKYEPSREKLFSDLLPRVVTSRIRQACLDAKASETGSRMTAMDAATRNAKQLARKLELSQNKLRQSKITSELLDIVGGAEALK